jgi:hypothetical protein
MADIEDQMKLIVARENLIVAIKEAPEMANIVVIIQDHPQAPFMQRFHFNGPGMNVPLASWMMERGMLFFKGLIH